MNSESKGPDTSNEEEKRLQKLLGYNVVDNYEQEGTFKHVVGMATRIFDVPIALVSFIDDKNILIQASVGMEGRSIVRKEVSLCSIAMQRDRITVFENTKLEKSLETHPMVHGDFGIQFYAGAPLVTSDGYKIGVLAIGDKKPKVFTEEDEKMLKGLAAIIMDELESNM